MVFEQVAHADGKKLVVDLPPSEGGTGRLVLAFDQTQRAHKMTLELPYATFLYRVTRHRIVAATDVSQLKTHHREVLALQACHPRFFASQRYIVYAVPAQVIPTSAPAYSPAA